MSWKATVQGKVNTCLRPLRIQVVKGRSTDPAVQSYISARKTITAARRRGVSVGEYIDQQFAEPGTTQDTVDAMIKIAALSSVEHVVEIGPGTGRYSEKVIEALRPAVYEMYETATDWLPHLAKLPNAVVRPCDGHTLASTASMSVDIVHAQKVFVYLPFDAFVGYLQEMARVVRPGGVVAFDVVTEACLEDRVIEAWVNNGTIYRPVPQAWVVNYLSRHGLEHVGSHTAVLVDGLTELLVFQRTD